VRNFKFILRNFEAAFA